MFFCNCNKKIIAGLYVLALGALLFPGLSFSQETSLSQGHYTETDLKSLTDQAQALVKQKKYDEAEELYQHLVTITEKTYGVDSALAAYYLYNLSFTYHTDSNALFLLHDETRWRAKLFQAAPPIERSLPILEHVKEKVKTAQGDKWDNYLLGLEFNIESLYSACEHNLDKQYRKEDGFSRTSSIQLKNGQFEPYLQLLTQEGRITGTGNGLTTGSGTKLSLTHIKVNDKEIRITKDTSFEGISSPNEIKLMQLVSVTYRHETYDKGTFDTGLNFADHVKLLSDPNPGIASNIAANTPKSKTNPSVQQAQAPSGVQLAIDQLKAEYPDASDKENPDATARDTFNKIISALSGDEKRSAYATMAKACLGNGIGTVDYAWGLELANQGLKGFNDDISLNAILLEYYLNKLSMVGYLDKKNQYEKVLALMQNPNLSVDRELYAGLWKRSAIDDTVKKIEAAVGMTLQTKEDMDKAVKILAEQIKAANIHENPKLGWIEFLDSGDTGSDSAMELFAGMAGGNIGIYVLHRITQLHPDDPVPYFMLYQYYSTYYKDTVKAAEYSGTAKKLFEEKSKSAPLNADEKKMLDELSHLRE